MLADPGALVDFGFSLDDGLAHLQSHDAGMLGLARSKDPGRLAHPLGPRGEGNGPPLEKGSVRLRQDSLESGAGRGRKSFENLASRGIDRLNAHPASPFFYCAALALPMISPKSDSRNEPARVAPFRRAIDVA